MYLIFLNVLPHLIIQFLVFETQIRIMLTAINVSCPFHMINSIQNQI